MRVITLVVLMEWREAIHGVCCPFRFHVFRFGSLHGMCSHDGARIDWPLDGDETDMDGALTCVDLQQRKNCNSNMRLSIMTAVFLSTLSGRENQVRIWRTPGRISFIVSYRFLVSAINADIFNQILTFLLALVIKAPKSVIERSNYSTEYSVRLPESSGGDYMVSLGVTHQVHCLVSSPCSALSIYHPPLTAHLGHDPQSALSLPRRGLRRRPNVELTRDLHQRPSRPLH